MSPRFIPGCDVYPIDIPERRKEEEDGKLRDAKVRIVKTLGQLGISKLDRGSEMISELEKIQFYIEIVPIPNPYDCFAKKYQLPIHEKVIQISHFGEERNQYYSAQTENGDEVAVARNREDISESLVESVKMMIKFVLG